MLSDGVKRVGVSLKRLKHRPIIIIAVAGGSCSGKTTFSRMISEKYGAAILNMDDYYKGGNPKSNFDVPRALDMALLRKHLAVLRAGKSIRKPVYDFAVHRRTGYEKFKPTKILILEGIFALHGSLKDDLKVFVSATAKDRTERRIKRDIAERGRTRSSIIGQLKVVNRMYAKHVLPTKKFADIVVSN